MLADVRFEPFSDGVVVRLAGEVDMSNADEIGTAIRHMVSNAALGVVLDLTEVDYFDSAGIHLIYDMREGLRVRGQGLRIVVPDGSPARESLRLAAVLETLDVEPDVEAAVAAFAPPAG